MSKTKIPTNDLVLHAERYMDRVLAALDDDARRKATAHIEAGGFYEVRVSMEINRTPCIELALIDEELEEHELHMVGGGPVL